MADRYWVGTVGNWNDTGHWSATDGGASGVSVPTSSDNVFVTNSSGIAGVRITLDVAAACNNFSWATGGTLANSFFAFSTFNLSVSGSCLFNPVSTNTNFFTTVTGELRFVSSGTGNTVSITRNGGVASYNQLLVRFDGTGEWTLTGNNDSDVGTLGQIVLSQGTLKGGSSQYNVLTFQVDSGNTKVFDMGSMEFGVFTAQFGGTSFTLVAGTSTLVARNVGGAGGALIFGGGNTFNNFILETSDGLELHDSNIWNDVNWSIPGAAVTLENGTTQTISTITLQGTSGHNLILNTDLPGAEAFLDVATVTLIQYVTPTDNHALGDIPFDDSVGGIDGGGNTNWLFTSEAFTPQAIIF